MSNPSAIFDPNEDKIREECGVFGIFGTSDAAAHTALGLHALQHRGQEAAGIAAWPSRRSITASLANTSETRPRLRWT